MANAPLAIPTFDGPIADAFAQAQEAGEPRLVPLRYYADDRGWSLMNLLQGVMRPEGQMNVSMQYPGVIKAWHRHRKQTDFWMCVKGHLKVGIRREADGTSWMEVVGGKRPAFVVIPPPLWHGAATVGPEPAMLVYYLTHQFDPADPDEERAAYDAFAGFPWQVQMR